MNIMLQSDIALGESKKSGKYKNVIIKTVVCLIAAFAVFCVLWRTQSFAAEYERPDYTDNEIPVITLHISEDEFRKVNESNDHSYKAENCSSIDLKVPEGFVSDFPVDSPLTDPESFEGLDLEYIRGRGNSTWTMDKRPYRFKLAKGKDLLGMGKSKHWVLIANYDDQSLMRNRIVLYMARRLGIAFTPKCMPVDFVVNDKYMGSYLLSENVRVDNGRVEIDELTQSEEDSREPNITGGYLLSIMPYDNEPMANIFNTDRMVPFQSNTPEFFAETEEDKTEIGTREQKEYIADYVQKAEDAIFGENCEDEQGVSYKEYMDMESAAKYWWLQEFTENGDAFRTPSTYLYKTRDKVDENGEITEKGKLFWGPAWDFDITFFSNADERETTPQDEEDGMVPLSFNTSIMPWLDHLRAYDEEYQNELVSTWEKFDTVLTDVVKDGGELDRMLEQIRKSGEDEQILWPKLDSDLTIDELVGQLKSNIEAKQRWVNRNIDQKLTDVKAELSFIADDTEIEHVKWTKGSSLGYTPEAPVIEGKTFICWKTADGEIFDEKEELKKDMVYHAEYKDTDSIVRPKELFITCEEYWAEVHSKKITPLFSIYPKQADVKYASWVSSNTDVVDVTNTGKVIIKGVGDATITGTINADDEELKQSKSYTVHVFDAFDFGKALLPEPEKIEIENKSITLRPGEYEQIRFKLSPAPHTVAPGFSYDGEGIIDVDDSGVVSAISPGKVEVEVGAGSGSASDTMTVIVPKYANKVKAKGLTVKARASALRKKTKTFARKKVIRLTNSKAKVRYTKLKGNKKISINKKTGKFTLKKGLKKGTYRVKIRVTSGDRRYVTKKKTVTVTVRIK